MLRFPPFTAETVGPELLEGYDVLYLDLHGKPGSFYLWAGKMQDVAALSVETVRGADLTGCVVFALSCYLPETPFLAAFVGAGATVIGGEGPNYGGRFILSGAQLVAQRLLTAMRQEGWTPADGLQPVLDAAAGTVTLHEDALADALAFRMWGEGAQGGDGAGEQGGTVVV